MRKPRRVPAILFPNAAKLKYVRFLSVALDDEPSDDEIELFLLSLATEVENLVQQDFHKQLRALSLELMVLPQQSEELQRLFIRENIKLIKSIPRRLEEDVEQIVLRGARQGLLTKDIEKQIAEKLQVTKKRAQLIARDQVSKYSGDLTRHNQKEAGITHYCWQTSRDERVRSRHSALEGQIFSWSKAPIADKSGARYHPKQAINCRCDAIPVLDSRS